MPDNKQTPPAKEGLLKKYLDNTFGEQGLKTDVKITLTNQTLVKIIAGAVAATALSTLTYFMIKTMFAGKNKVSTSIPIKP
jgi:hypothetical protein